MFFLNSSETKSANSSRAILDQSITVAFLVHVVVFWKLAHNIFHVFLPVRIHMLFVKKLLILLKMDNGD